MGHQRRVDRQDVPKEDAELVDALRHVSDMVSDIAQVLLEIVADPVLVEPVRELIEHTDQRHRRTLKVDDLPCEFVDAPRDAGIAVEHLRLDFIDVVGEARDHGNIGIDHRVENRVQNCFRATRKQIGSALQPPANQRQIGRFGVTDSDDEVLADEHVKLAELHLFFRIEVARRPKDYEECRAVAFDLRALVRKNRILNSEFVQAELRGERRELIGARTIEADPRHGSGAGVERRVGVAERGGGLDAASILVDCIVDQAGAHLPRLWCCHARRSRGGSRSQRERAEGLAKIGGHGQNGSPVE